MEDEKREACNLARDTYLSWMAEMKIDEMLEEYQKKQFGWKAFLFYFGASVLGSYVAQVLARCFS